MKKQNKPAIFIVILLILIVGIIIYKNYSTQNNNTLSEQQASEIAIKALVNDGSHDWLKHECVKAFVQEKDLSVIKFNINEVHNVSCGGDPNTSPRIGSVSIDLKTGLVIK